MHDCETYNTQASKGKEEERKYGLSWYAVLLPTMGIQGTLILSISAVECFGRTVAERKDEQNYGTEGSRVLHSELGSLCLLA